MRNAYNGLCPAQVLNGYVSVRHGLRAAQVLTLFVAGLSNCASASAPKHECSTKKKRRPRGMMKLSDRERPSQLHQTPTVTFAGLASSSRREAAFFHLLSEFAGSL